jgi:Cu+-exporting ATPase
MFDKTGTLTVGKPVVVNTRLLKNMELREFYVLVAATEVYLCLCGMLVLLETLSL